MLKIDKNYTSLHIAVSNERIDAVKVLLEHQADVTVEDADGNTPLILACQNQNPEIMELLLEYHSNVHHKNNWVAPDYIMLRIKKWFVFY